MREMTAANEASFRGLARLLRAAGRSPKTEQAYRSACQSMEDYLCWTGAGSPDLLAVTKADVTGWLIELQERGGWSPGPDGIIRQSGRPFARDSLVSYFTSLRRFYNYALEEDLLQRSPVAKVDVPRPSGKPVAVPPVDLVRGMIQTTRPGRRGRTFHELRDEFMIRLYCEPGGPRCSEVALLPLEHLDLRKDEVTICGKGGKWRKIAMSGATAQAGERYLRARPAHRHAARTDRVFLGHKGPLSPSGAYQAIKERAALAGGDLHPHQLRHLAADLCATDGMQEGAMMTLFGWSTPRMAQRYGAARAQERALEISRRHAIGDRL